MKTPSRMLARLALAVSALLTPVVSSAADSGKPLTIAVVGKATTHSYWKSVEAGARKAGEELNVKIEWQGPLDDSKVADQIAIFNNLATSGIDGMVFAPCDDKALAPHVRTAARRGLPISIIDSPLAARQGRDYINYVSTDNKAAGNTAADTLIKLVGPQPAYGGQVLMIRFTEGSASTRQREDGFTERLARDGAFRIVAQQFTDGSMAGAQRVAETLLGNYVKNNKLELDGIFAPNQPSAEGTYNAVNALRKKGVEVKARFVGFDDSALLLQGLDNGVVDALVVQAPFQMGYLGVKSVVAHIKREPVEALVDTGVSVKTKDNK
ncbi:ABC-type sugar transport system, periplasmic component [Opitutaceae bacterium TAV1]|nr:ABC-type sugar transport system, periplasmic component [Opitutaceae bacterium TAV1]